MLRFLELANDAVAGTVAQLVAWFQGLAASGSLDPRNWQPLTWLIVAAVLLLLLAPLLLRRRRAAPRHLPEMMLSHGEIVLLEEPAGRLGEAAELGYGMGAPARAHHRLELTVSNLNDYPVQLLELAVRTRGLRLPVVAEAGSVVPPNGAVDVVAELFDLPGDAGVIELYLYSNRGRRRTFRVSAPLEWEPWAKRYRVRALALRTAPVKRLASQERRRRERRSYESAKRRERQKELAETTWRRAEELGRQLAERRAAERRPAGRAASERPAAERLPGERPFPDRFVPGRRAPSSEYVAAETVYTGAAAPAATSDWAGTTTVPRPVVERYDHDEVDENAAERDDFRPVPREEEPGEAPAPRRRLEFPDEF